MILKNVTLDKFAENIRKKHLILFGAGTLLKSWIPYVLDEYGIQDRVVMVADNDPSKWGMPISINGKVFLVQRMEDTLQNIDSDTVILITSSYFATIIDQFEERKEFEFTECYVAPIMYSSGKKEVRVDIKKWQYPEQQIPKKIHYCWFGEKPMSDLNRHCVDSWRKFCPDYEIIEWNEKNYDIKKNKYMRQAYEAGMYGFVPDYARIDILYQYGGIYLDTDVEIIKNLDDLLFFKAYTSFEEYPMVNFGGGSGSVKGFPLLKEILDFRKKEEFINIDGSYNKTACGYYESLPLRRAGLKLNGELQNIQDMIVFSSEYFHPRSSMNGLIGKTSRTYSIHWFNWSWIDKEGLEERFKNQEEYKHILKRMKRDET